MLLAMFYWIAFIIKPKRRLFRPVLIVLPSYTARWQHCHRAVVALPLGGGNAATERCTMEGWAFVNGRMPVCKRLKAYLRTAIFLNNTTKDVHSTSHDKENPIEMITLGRGMANLLVAFILLVLLVQVQTFLRNGEYGSKTCFFAVNRSTLVVCLGIFPKSYEVLTSPSFPYQF